MKKIISGMFVCVMMAGIGCVVANAQGDQRDRNTDIYAPRYLDRLCPPEYPETREWMEGFMRAEHMGGKLRELFGAAAPESIAEIEVLNDAEDAYACEYFSGRYDKLINKQVRLFDDAEAYYLHDLTFYKGGDFYFVAIGGGFLVDEDPQGSGKEHMFGSGVSGIQIHHKDSFDYIDLDSAYWDLLNR